MNAIFMIGLPGSGKSTWIKSNAEGYYIVSADKHKEFLSQAGPDLHQKSVELADNEFHKFILEKKPVLVDGGGINNNYTRKQIEYARQNGYTVKLVVVDTPVSVCLERNKKRDRNFIVPQEAIIRKAVRFDRCLNNLLPLADEIETVEYYRNQIYFVDMDGTIAAYRYIPKDEHGGIDFVDGEYFSLAKPVLPMISKLQKLHISGKTINILSAAPDSMCQDEKLDWLDKHFSFYNKAYFIGNKQYKFNMLNNIVKREKLDVRDITVIDDDHRILDVYNENGFHAIHPSMFLVN